MKKSFEIFKEETLQNEPTKNKNDKMEVPNKGLNIKAFFKIESFYST